MSDTSLDIAIIGIGVRAPGARSAAEFWRNLAGGRESITFFDKEQLAANQDLVGDPRFVMAAGPLGDVDTFDADFFGFSPRDAELTHPQHRLFLECAWEAFEDAGYDAGEVPRRVSVYGGQTGNSEYVPMDPWQVTLASSLPECERLYVPNSNHLTTRVSHVLGLTGESLEVRAACASGLVALSLGCRSLLSGQADMSLVGGAHVFLPEYGGYLVGDDSLRFSADGHTRPFDRRAHGAVHTSAVGVLLLKRLDDAVRDRDPIYAVVRGTAVNNDGPARTAYGTPGVEQQAECVAEAHLAAGVPAETITYVEAHGIAVPVSDAVEIEAMRRAFAARTGRTRFCALGSVKANIGHSGPASGTMGLVKTALALKHGTIPPQINFEEPHPYLDLDHGPFVVHRGPTAWRPDCGVRRAGVHSFGVGGTNAHAVLEEAPASTVADDDASRPRLIVLSARTGPALDLMRQRLRDHVESHPGQRLGDIAYTLAVGRRAQPLRWAAVVGDRAQLLDSLRAGPDGSRLPPPVLAADPAVLTDLARAWVAGRPVDWRNLFAGETRQRVSLPTYPFQRQRYWLDPPR